MIKIGTIKAASVILVLLLVSCGCINEQQSASGNQTPQETAPVTSIPVTTILQTTPPPQTPVPASPTLAPEPVLTDESIKKHFLNIAFGRDSNYIRKYSQDSGEKVSFYLSGKFDEGDKALIENFSREYNMITTTSTFADEVLKSKQDAYPGEINLVFFPAESLKSMEESGIRHKEVNIRSGDIQFYLMHSGDTLYFNTDLSGDERKHAIMKGLLYYLGYPGQTYDYPSSIFYANGYTNTLLSPIDVAAINTMYDGRIYSGMSFDAVKRVLLFN